jgi:hypothetical protein
MKSLIISLLCVTIFSLSGISQATMIGDREGDIANVGANGHLDVSVGDQTSPALIVNMNRTLNTTTLTSPTAIGNTTIVVAAATGFVNGAHITLTDPVTGRYYTGHQVGAIATLTVTLDTPIDFAYPVASTEVSNGTHDLTSSVGTLASPVIYSVRAGEITDVPVTVDITRVIITCSDDAAIAMNLFCGGTALTNGLVLRTINGTTQNIFNIKTNQDLMNIAYDFTTQLVAGTPPGFDGFVSRLTFAGQNKMGVAIRLGPGEDLEMLVQDDLSGILTLHVIAEGHVVVPN